MALVNLPPQLASRKNKIIPPNNVSHPFSPKNIFIFVSCIDALLLSLWPICRLIPWPPPQPMESHYLLPPPFPSPLLSPYYCYLIAAAASLAWLGLVRARDGNGGQRKPRV